SIVLWSRGRTGTRALAEAKARPKTLATEPPNQHVPGNKIPVRTVTEVVKRPVARVVQSKQPNR
ncbi:hypothetical protein ACFL3I_11315, partial [Pseudomonadota bacterium]